MRWLTKYTRPVPTHATTRLKRVFAYFPTYIDGYTVWLENYETLQAYISTDYLLQVDHKPIKFTVGNWVDISKRTIKK